MITIMLSIFFFSVHFRRHIFNIPFFVHSFDISFGDLHLIVWLAYVYTVLIRMYR